MKIIPQWLRDLAEFSVMRHNPFWFELAARLSPQDDPREAQAMIENSERDLKAAQAALTLALYRRDAEKITEAIDVLITIKLMIAFAEADAIRRRGEA